MRDSCTRKSRRNNGYSGSKGSNGFRPYYFGFHKKKSAVSEALGTIMLLGIAMALIGLVYYWVASLPSPEEDIRVDLKGTMEIVNNQRVVFIEHKGGEPLDVHQIQIIIKLNNIAERTYIVADSNAAIFDNDLWEVGETWHSNINAINDWNLSLPEVKIEVRDINSESIIYSHILKLGGDAGDLPDLKVGEEDISFDFLNTTLKPDEWVNISANIRNIGDSDAVDVLVRFFDGNNIISYLGKDYIYIATIPTGSYETVAVNWTPHFSGARSIHVKIYSNQIEESYTNNYAVRKLEVEPFVPEITGPNLEIEGITFSPETPTHGDWVTISVLVKNVGDEEVPKGALINMSIWDEDGFLLPQGIYYNFSRVITKDLTIFETLLPAFSYNSQTTFGGTTTIWAEVSTNVFESRINDNRLYANLQILPTILLIDDDNVFEKYTQDDASSYMDTSLQLAVGSGQFDILTIKGTEGPKYESGDKPLKNYDIVIWCTGYQTSNTITASDRVEIVRYLNNHGKLWLIGMNIVPNLATQTSFLYNYLGVDNYQVTGTPTFLYGVAGENLTQGMELNTSNLIKARDNGVNLTLRQSDYVNHTIDGILGNDEFFGQNGNMSLKYHNITNDFKVVLFSWEFAAINDMISRNNLTIQILKWFGWELEVGTDLAISSKGFDNENPNFMDWVMITATVRNNGPRDLAAVRVDFFIIDEEGNEERIPEYPGFDEWENPQRRNFQGNGFETAVYKRWLAVDVGRHTFRVVVDLEDEIDEVSEENNDDFYSPLFVTQLYIGYTILVVDDDNSTNNGGTFPNSTQEITDALDELGYFYDIYVTSGGMTPGNGPDIEVMKRYNSVIWCTGYDGNHTLLTEDQTELTNYMTRSNFNESNFLGDTRYNAWIIGQGILNDLYLSGTNIVPSVNSFIYEYLQVQQYTTLNPRLPQILNGKYRDNLTHGMSYPMIRSNMDWTDTIVPTNDAYGIFWHDVGQTNYNGLRFNDTIHNLVFMPWVFSLINDTTTTQYVNESYKSELAYAIMSWFLYPDDRFEIKTSNIDIKLSNYDPVLGGSYVIKTNIYNLGVNNTNVIVRFLDGDTIINTKSIYVPGNGNSSTEVIWSPLYAGYRNIHIYVDPENDIPEVFNYLNNNATYANQLVYFFYDDMENGTSNWNHDNTVLLINGEGPLNFIENPVYTDINGTWDYSMSDGFILNSTEYHSYDSSYYTIEPVGINKKPLDIVLVVDTSSSMAASLDEIKKALVNFINSTVFDPRDRIAIYSYSNEAPDRIINFTICNASGKAALISQIAGLSAAGFPALWDSIGEAVNYSLYSGSSRIPVVIALSGAGDFGSGGAPGGGPEDGSEDYAPWHDWSENIWGKIQYKDRGTNPGEDHFGKYVGAWSWQDLDNASNRENRYGLLNVTYMKVFTIGLGIEHDNNTANTSNRFPGGWMGEYAQYESGLNLTGDQYNESGSHEFNLWRIANTSGAEYLYAPNAGRLNRIYNIISQLVIEEVEIGRSAQVNGEARTGRSSRASILSDGFETGDFTAGPWLAQAGWTVSTADSYAGTYHAQARGNIRATMTLNNDLDLTNYENLTLTFYHYTVNVETTDFMYVDVSINSGSTWVNVRSWDGQSIEFGAYRVVVINLSAYDGESRFRLRFRVDMNQNVETWLIDNVALIGNSTGGGGPGPVPPTIKDLYLAGDRNLTTYPFSLVNVTSAKLTFYHKYDIRTALNGVVIMVGIPDATGVNWTFEYARPSQPYTGNYLLTMKRYDDYNNEMRWCWNGISGNGKYTWDYVEVDLTNWTGSNQVRIKLAFLWAGPGVGGAYFVDDFKVKVSRNESLPLSEGTVDQWDYVSTQSHSGNHCWWNRNITTGHLSGGLDNSLYSRPIDLTNARNATLSAYFKFNINTESGRPPDGFRVEISEDNGVTWKAINLGARTAWGVSTNGTDNDDGVLDGKSYSGLDNYGDDTSTDGWVEASTLTRLNTDISGWAGSVIILRIRIVTASNANPYYGAQHYEWGNPTNNAYGLMIDDVIIYGFSLLN
jgi:hypothetical protein